MTDLFSSFLMFILEVFLFPPLNTSCKSVKDNMYGGLSKFLVNISLRWKDT